MMLVSMSQTYRAACREIMLPAEQKVQFMRLLREMSVNAAKMQKAWTCKEDFIALWWVSIGRFPTLCEPEISQVIITWVERHLPFELTAVDKVCLIN